MITYNVTFTTANVRATDQIDAATPEQALFLARRIAKNESDTLNWYPIDPSDDVESIEITDSGDETLATWHCPGLTLRLNAAALLEALENAADYINVAQQDFALIDNGTLADIYTVIARAKGGEP